MKTGKQISAASEIWFLLLGTQSYYMFHNVIRCSADFDVEIKY